jgi:hypothetical protein
VLEKDYIKAKEELKKRGVEWQIILMIIL